MRPKDDYCPHCDEYIFHDYWELVAERDELIAEVARLRDYLAEDLEMAEETLRRVASRGKESK